MVLNVLILIKKVFFIFNTVRYLKFNQIFYRLIKSFRRVKVLDKGIYNLRNDLPMFVHVDLIPSSYIDNDCFIFLNKKNSISNWNNESYDKLWLYNLHYFDDLNSSDSLNRKRFHSSLISKWIIDNPILEGNGWEPYTLSLRIVNWIKWFKRNQDVHVTWQQSLRQQVFVLEQSLEYHLMGNHLFANAKALIFAGGYFSGIDAERWLSKGFSILDNELKEQILSDGGNFELSPMYHQIILADILDLVNLSDSYSISQLHERSESWRSVAAQMLAWAKLMNHPDGEVSFFNDSSIGIAPKLDKLFEYAGLLNIKDYELSPSISSSTLKGTYLNGAGYTVIEGDDIKAILDTAKIGPDYIPGHAHADTLSFELSLFGQRVFVNSGTGEYGVSEERLRQRKTAAHNTVDVDGYDSSEVWSGFRVARRAYPSGFKINTTGSDEINVLCSHGGYKRLKGKVVHSRNWTFKHNKITIKDSLLGKYLRATSHIHLHPEVLITSQGDKSITLQLISGHIIHVTFDSSIRIEDTTWHPEFGLSIPNKKIVFDIWNGESEFFINY